MCLKEKRKHKKSEKKEEEDILYVYTRKKCEKHCSIYHLKVWKHPSYKGLKKKESIKKMKKGRGG